MEKITVTPSINPESANRLEAKHYEKDYTDVPNRVLPEDVFRAISAIYAELSGGGGVLELEDSTFCVRAQGGILKSILAPSVYREASYNEAGEATPGNRLVIRWGKELFPIDVTKEGFTSPMAKNKKFKLALKSDTSGKYENTCLSATLTNSTTKEIYSMLFPLRSADWDNKIDTDIADVLLEEENVTALLDYFQLAPNPEGSGGNSGGRMQGHFVKAAQFPAGEYVATQYRSRARDGKFGKEYYIQVEVPEPFSAQVPEKQEDGTWGLKQVEVFDYAVMVANSPLKRILSASPVITPESPARLELYDHGEYDGKPTVKVRLEVSAFEHIEGEINLDF